MVQKKAEHTLMARKKYSHVHRSEYGFDNENALCLCFGCDSNNVLTLSIYSEVQCIMYYIINEMYEHTYKNTNIPALFKPNVFTLV